MSEEEILEKLKGPQHVVVGDCPDCGRVLIYNSRCGKCGGASWLPAGYIDRQKIHRMIQEATTG